MTLQGKVILITGGTRGVGASCARALAERGARVVVNYLQDAATAEQLVAQIRASGGDARAMQADVLDKQQVAQLVAETMQAYSRIDALVSNFDGGWLAKPFAHMNWDEFAAHVNAELKAAFEITKAIAPIMVEQQYGRIIYMASGLAKRPTAGTIAAGTAKAALAAFTRYIANEYGPEGITANAIAPGLIEGQASESLPPQARQAVISQTPLRRLVRPDDIARVVAFLADEDSGFMTGVYVPVNGGISME